MTTLERIAKIEAALKALEDHPEVGLIIGLVLREIAALKEYEKLLSEIF